MRNDATSHRSETPSDIIRHSNAHSHNIHPGQGRRRRFGQRVSKPPPKSRPASSSSFWRRLKVNFSTALEERRTIPAPPRGSRRRPGIQTWQQGGPPPLAAPATWPKGKISPGGAPPPPPPGPPSPPPPPPPPNPIYWYTPLLPERATGIGRPNLEPQLLPLVNTLPVTGFVEWGNRRTSYYLKTSAGPDILVSVTIDRHGKERQTELILTSSVIEGQTQDRAVRLPSKFDLRILIRPGLYREFPLLVHLATGVMQPQGLDWQFVPPGYPPNTSPRWEWVPVPVS